MDIRVLHVDDNEDFLEIACSYLEKGYDRLSVVGVGSPEEAVSVLEKKDIDCIVSDYDMPFMDGLGLLKQVRDKYPKMPFILFTSKGSEEVASEAITAGPSDYVRKDSGSDTFDLLVNRIESSVAQARAEEEIEKRERRLSNHISNIPGMVYRCTDEPNWPFEFASDGCEEVTGYPPEMLENDEITWRGDIIHPLDKERVRNEIENSIEGDTGTFELEYRIITRENKVKWVWERGNPVGEEDGKRYLEGVISDTKESVGLEGIERYETVLDAIPDGIYVLDDEGHFLDTNGRFAEISGYGIDGLIGEHMSHILGDESAQKAEKAIAELLKSGEDVTSFEDSFTTKDGEKVRFEVRISPLFSDGSFSGTVGVVRDVSEERKRAEKLRQLHATTRTLVSSETPEDVANTVTQVGDEVLDISTDGVYTRDGDTLEPLSVSERAKELFGGIPSLPVDGSLAGKALREGETLTIEDVRDHQDVYDPDTPIRSELFVPMGENAVFVAGHAGERGFTEEDIEFAEILCSNARAVLERLEKEAEIREREEWFRSLIEYSNDIITILEDSGTMKYQSPSIERILGYDPEENLGESAFDWMHPDDRTEMVELFAESVGSDEPIRTDEYRLRHNDGSWRYMESIGTDRRDDPEVGGIVINSRDVTERVKRERELERQNERLEKFASILSHDLRNPMNVACGSIDIARNSEQPDEHLERAEGALERIQDMLEDILTLASEGESVKETQELSLREVAERAWEGVPTEESNRDADLVVDAGTIEAEKPRVLRLLENLFRNSIEHADEATVTVTVGELDGTGFYVEDNGEGIPKEEREDVFEYGYTTAEDGTGIGLSIVKTIVDAHGWEVRLLESEKGGARFEFDTAGAGSI